MSRHWSPTRCDQRVTKDLLVPVSSKKESPYENETEDTLCSINQPVPSKECTRGKINFINTKLVAALDKCKLSDTDAVQIIMATAEALGHNSENLINRTSIKRCHQELHTERSLVIRNERLT